MINILIPIASNPGTMLIGFTIRFKGVQTGAVLWKHDFFNSIGGWDPQLLRFQDYFLILVALSRCLCFTVSQSGAWVVRGHSSPDRVSQRRDVRTERSVIGAIKSTFVTLRNFYQKKMGVFWPYSLAVQLYRWNQKKEAEIGLALARRLGLRGHPVNLRHRLACMLLGIQFKEKLAELKRSIL